MLVEMRKQRLQVIRLEMEIALVTTRRKGRIRPLMGVCVRLAFLEVFEESRYAWQRLCGGEVFSLQNGLLGHEFVVGQG